MSFCIKCGEECIENENYCSKCGNDNSDQAIALNNLDQSKYNNLAVSAFTLSLVSMFITFFGVLPIIAIISSIFAVINVSKTKEKGKGIAIAGICIGCVTLASAIIFIIF